MEQKKIKPGSLGRCQPVGGGAVYLFFSHHTPSAPIVNHYAGFRRTRHREKGGLTVPK